MIFEIPMRITYKDSDDLPLPFLNPSIPFPLATAKSHSRWRNEGTLDYVYEIMKSGDGYPFVHLQLSTLSYIRAEIRHNLSRQSMCQVL